MQTIPHIILHLDQSGCRYALYLKKDGQAPVLAQNHDRFVSASLIKLPILLAWAALERAGRLDRFEPCSLDGEAQVHGAGLAWLLAQRSLPYQDVLLLMIALSDNLCANLVIHRVGLEALNLAFRQELGLLDTRLERKFMDFAARAQGKDNWISARDCIRLLDCLEELPGEQRAWIEPMLAHNQDRGLLLRQRLRDGLDFNHKTASLTGVLHDWGYTPKTRLFLLTQEVQDETALTHIFGDLGEHID